MSTCQVQNRALLMSFTTITHIFSHYFNQQFQLNIRKFLLLKRTINILATLLNQEHLQSLRKKPLINYCTPNEIISINILVK